MQNKIVLLHMRRKPSNKCVLAVLDQIIPIADQLQAYYVERRFEKDNFKGSDELAAQYVPLAEQFYATYKCIRFSFR